MSDGMSAVIVLLVAIVILLCTKQEDRGKTIGLWVLIAGAFFLIKNVGPFVLASGAWLISNPDVFIGSIKTLGGLLFVGLAIYLVYAAWDRELDDQAIRAGSVAAFDQRVESLMRSHNYTRERAIEETKQVRNGKSAIPFFPLFMNGIMLAIGIAVLYKPARHYLIAAVCLSLDGFMAYTGISQWKAADSFEEKFRTVLIAVSAACGTLAFTLMCVPSVPSGPAGWLTGAAILTFVVGIVQNDSKDAENKKAQIEPTGNPSSRKITAESDSASEWPYRTRK